MNQSTNRYPLKGLATHVAGGVGVFICSSSYEDRCLSIPLRIKQESVEHAIILENTDIGEVRGNADRLLKYFGARASRVEVLTGDPIQSVQGMYAVLEPIVRGAGR